MMFFILGLVYVGTLFVNTVILVITHLWIDCVTTRWRQQVEAERLIAEMDTAWNRTPHSSTGDLPHE